MGNTVMTLVVSMIGLVMVLALGFGAWMVYTRVVSKDRVVDRTSSFSDADISNRISDAEERVLQYVRPALRTLTDDIKTLQRTLDTRITNTTNNHSNSIADLRSAISSIQNEIRNVHPQLTTFMSEVHREVTKQLQDHRTERRSKDETIYEYIKNEIARISDKISYVDRQMVNHIVKMHNK